MESARRLGLARMAAATLALAGVGAGFAALPAVATTGNADGYPEPKVLVNAAVGDRYIGRFYLSRIERSARVVSAIFDIDYTESVEHEFIVGDAVFYQYDKAGQLTSWTAAMYPWEFKNGLMHCKLLVPGSETKVLGKVVEEAPKNPDTEAHPYQETIPIRLTLGGSTYRATLSQGEDDSAPPTSLPKALQTAAVNTAEPGEPPAEAAETTEGAGIYASVVHYAVTLSQR